MKVLSLSRLDKTPETAMLFLACIKVCMYAASPFVSGGYTYNSIRVIEETGLVGKDSASLLHALKYACMLPHR